MNVIGIDFILDQISEIIPYIDKMIIWFQKNPNLDIDELKKSCGEVKPYRGWKHWRDPNTKKLKFNYRWEYKLELLQPSEDAIEYLARRTKCKYVIGHVEMALDFIADSFGNANMIGTFFDICWIQRWHCKQQPGCYYHNPERYSSRGTTYYSTRKSVVNYVIYSDKVSKIRNLPCCHLEVRIQESKAVKRNRMDSFIDYLSPAVHYFFWKKHLQLRAVQDCEHIREKTIQTLKRRKIEGYYEIANIILHLFRLGRGYITAQNIIQYGKWISAEKRFLRTIPKEAFLPPKA